MTVWNSLTKLVAATAAIGVAGAIATAPVAAISAVAVERTNDTMQSNLEDLTVAQTPGVTTITDKNDTPIAWLYTQRRYEITSEQISQTIKDAIVAIEDRRFYEHNGVDIQGNLRAIATNLLAGGVEQGASTIDQQYVKNYLLLVASATEDEQTAATETSIPRKLREMRMASAIDAQLSKDEILTRYLNLIPFGNNAYGIEAAAQTYFGIPAAELNVPQSAMLAGIVQSSSYLNPYTNPEGVTERRNTVLQAMVDAGVLAPEAAASFSLEPLGVLETPTNLANGCIASGDSGFFCDYVLRYLDEKGLSTDQLTRGSYTIKTTLDPEIQAVAHEAASGQVNGQTNGVAEVMNIIAPGKDSRNILAMTSSRSYGLDLEAGETVFPQASSLVGNGAGSIFKIFTAAVALEQGYGLNTMLNVPARYEAVGLGEGGAANCPANTYCVENSGSYAPQMTLRDALAYSPNTTFVQLIERVGVEPVVDLSVKMGLRSYAQEGTFDGTSSIANYVKDHNLGSYTLGPTAVNALELSNVAATLASGGVWCEPNPVDKVTDASGNEIYIERPACEQALSGEIADALVNGMSDDSIKGTATDAARAYGWNSPLAAKTGTTESHYSSAFLGLNDNFAAATYIYNDGTSNSPLCTGPARQCGSGTMFGGNEPARTWFAAASRLGAAQGALPGYDLSFDQGAGASLSSRYAGRPIADVRRELEEQGYSVLTQLAPGNGIARDDVVRVEATLPLRRGSTVTVYVSDGTTTRPTPREVTRPEPQANDIQDNIESLLQQLLGGR
ncbi:transglycosylase domain-containing protein [Corynebacterium kutscheri]|uniref:Membrane carboxypeptidase (Penicillin-binding protein) n=1 Tax=Corynebacterium kutscheri TaxID=35755 RepID=A0A0F6QY80_9CORY|nr:transglycosylase domain-containing protein [Corynebacterium kutscheri]AKE40407.1 membrane carboxypeptidase (penicillin-binding protein) [Corynebacterium kutscheri]VEH05265.1 putative penicillin-binding secreted protein 1 [Corynebacterium kutscheri]VEH10802.1 putative penicillin-binding secreted protein 1 [Corynebacterium kutscheri]